MSDSAKFYLAIPKLGKTIASIQNLYLLSTRMFSRFFFLMKVRLKIKYR